MPLRSVIISAHLVLRLQLNHSLLFHTNIQIIIPVMRYIDFWQFSLSLLGAATATTEKNTQSHFHQKLEYTA